MKIFVYFIVYKLFQVYKLKEETYNNFQVPPQEKDSNIDYIRKLMSLI